ncbi:MAG: glycosyltransferase family 39 protein [Planctomycetes bacterium]|nr:glycosyltransferase family 39 protein [Planctomycetota bacterium]
MSSTKPLPAPAPKVRKELALPLVLVAIFAFHALKGYGMYMTIFPDERLYSQAARLYPLATAAVPNYLFYAIFRLTGWFDPAYLDAARVLNAVFFTAAGVFIFLVARRLCGYWLAVAVTTLSLMSPVSIYTLYFMPESLQFACFWCLTWLLVRFHSDRLRFGLLVGGCVGAMALVKTHGMFLVPPLVLWLFLTGKSPLRTRAGQAAALLAGFATVRLGLGYLFAGPYGLTLLGSSYSEGLTTGLVNIDWGEFLLGVGYNAYGHAVGLSLVVGVPLVLTGFFLRRIDRGNGEDVGRRLALLFLLILLTYGAVSVGFVALIDFFDFRVFSGTERLQARYYNFLAPAAPILAAYGWSRFTTLRPSKSWLAAPCLLLVLAAYAVVTGFAGYRLVYYLDCPVISSAFHFTGTDVFPILSWPLALVALAPTVCLLFHWRAAILIFLCVTSPVLEYSYLAYNQREVVETHLPYPFWAHYATHVREKLGPDLAQLAILDETQYEGNIVHYLLDEPVPYIILPKGDGRIDPAVIPDGTKWLLVLGRSRIPESLPQYDHTVLRVDPEILGNILLLVRIGPAAAGE